MQEFDVEEAETEGDPVRYHGYDQGSQHDRPTPSAIRHFRLPLPVLGRARRLVHEIAVRVDGVPRSLVVLLVARIRRDYRPRLRGPSRIIPRSLDPSFEPVVASVDRATPDREIRRDQVICVEGRRRGWYPVLGAIRSRAQQIDLVVYVLVGQAQLLAPPDFRGRGQERVLVGRQRFHAPVDGACRGGLKKPLVRQAAQILRVPGGILAYL